MQAVTGTAGGGETQLVSRLAEVGGTYICSQARATQRSLTVSEHGEVQLGPECQDCQAGQPVSNTELDCMLRLVGHTERKGSI